MSSSVETTEALYRRAAEKIQAAKHILISAGAGMGVDSGLPDFRGDEGFWAAYPPLKGHSFVKMANPSRFLEDPHRAWGFYGHRLNLYRQTIPHDGFHLLQKWTVHKDWFIFTSNVDGAFQKVGFDQQKINECHGSIHHFQYLEASNNQEVWADDSLEVVVDMTTVRAQDPLPQRNGKLLRPNILMFGDWGWISDRSSKQEERYDAWLTDIDATQTVVIEMGAGTAIPTVRSQGNMLERQGATLIRINPREAHGSSKTISIYGGAKASLMGIDAYLD